MTNPPEDRFSKAYCVHCSSIEQTAAIAELAASMKSKVEALNDGWIRLVYLD